MSNTALINTKTPHILRVIYGNTNKQSAFSPDQTTSLFFINNNHPDVVYNFFIAMQRTRAFIEIKKQK